MRRAFGCLVGGVLLVVPVSGASAALGLAAASGAPATLGAPAAPGAAATPGAPASESSASQTPFDLPKPETPEWFRGREHTFDDPESRVERPWYYERAVTADDLNGRTLRELSLLRNWIFARAHNPFRRAWLHDFFSAQPWYEARPALVDSLVTDLDRANAAFIAGYEAAIPPDVLGYYLADLVNRSERDPLDDLEIELVRERMGLHGTGFSGANSPLANPARLDSLLTIEDLDDFSRRDLSLLRNLIYARRHRPFRSPELSMYFSRYGWYSADSTYTDDRLTPTDIRNINMIQSVEEEIGGPVDAGQGAFWFGGA